jgi:4,5:9,10-diseco-3-hydroxy-5,9,17-trioxoandrosta-1(10),2-diene-4-oate hydrolase
MLFAQPSRVPSAFLAEQHAIARLPGRLEASTTRARAILGPTGQREVLLDELSRLHMPTLVMWGEHDNVLPVHQAHTAVGRLSHGHLTLFPDCGHLPHVELPERFAAVLGAFLAEHDGAGCT